MPAPDLGEPKARAIPSPLGRSILTFVFLSLIEYWVAPPLLGITNYAGLWSDLGMPLLALFLAAMIIFVVRPLVPLLRPVVVGRRRVLFAGLWIGASVAVLALTNAIQFGAPVAASLLGSTVVYGPFGAWPSLTFAIGGTSVFGTLDPSQVAVVGLLSWLWAGSVLLGLAARSAACPVPVERPGWRGRLYAVAVWGPFGWITGCAACAPAYLALLGAVAPGVAATGYAGLPLVPWIGFAGLLYLVSYVLILILLHRQTRGPAVGERPIQGSPIA